MAAYDITALDTPLGVSTPGAGGIYLRRLSDTKIIGAWEAGLSDKVVQIFDIDRSTGEITALSSPFSFFTTFTQWVSESASIVRIDDTHFAIFWMGDGNDGFVRTFEFNPGTGAVSFWGAQLEYDTNNGQNPSAVSMDTNHILNAWTGPSEDGFARVFEINMSNGNVTGLSTAFEYDTTLSISKHLVMMNDTKAIVAYIGGTTNIQQVRVLDINTSTWAVSGANSSFTFRSNGSSSKVNIVSLALDSSVVFSTPVDGSPTGKLLRPLSINTSTWAVSNLGSEVQVHTGSSESIYNKLLRIDDTHFIVFYTGNDNDGFARTYEIDPSDGDLTLMDELEFDPTNGTSISITDMGDGLIVASWANSGTKLGAFQVEIPQEPPEVALNTPDETVFNTPTPKLEFTGADPDDDDITYEVEIYSPGMPSEVVDSCSEANANQPFNTLGLNTSRWRYGQSFTGDGKKIGSVEFYLSKNGSPTGDIWAEVWSHSGTFGTSSIGDTLLATSDVISAATVPTSFNLVELFFSGADQITLANSTRYVIVLVYESGNFSNHLLMNKNSGGNPHPGNTVSADSGGTWSFESFADTIFYVHSVEELPELIITALSATDPGFLNEDDNPDTDPFTSGDQMSYTVQSGDELPEGTYNWRARGRDPGGSDEWGEWSEVREFIIGQVAENPGAFLPFFFP